MSGFVGIVGTDGRPLDPSLVERLTDALAYRGPDRHGTRVLDGAALGHALLATTREAVLERQPMGIGDDLWITGDVRIDARGDLLRALRIRPAEPITDPELVLRAYREWGAACLDRLLGDFAFAIWDGRRRTLFCARDPLGVKLLYWARLGGTLVVGNTLASFHAHPAASTRLDPVAIGDFLLWGGHFEWSRTTFADIRAVPLGHTLVWSADRPATAAVTRWWTPPEEPDPAPFAATADWVEEFGSVLDAAVDDRLRTSRAAVFMSGGMDSSMVAAVVRDRLAASGAGFELRASTVVFDELIPDEERRYATLVADRLGIPIDVFPIDAWDRSWDWLLEDAGPEPEIHFSNASSRRAFAAVARHSRVAFTGYDGDALLAHSLGALWRLRLARGEAGSLMREIAWHVGRRRLPRVGVRAALGRWRARLGSAADGYPPWLSADFARAVDLKSRWRAILAGSPPPGSPRGRALAYLETPVWRSVIDCSDPGMTGFPIESRHPLMDLRVIRFVLRSPVVPWSIDKELFRAAMRSRLPEAVLRRPKTPLRADPTAAGVLAAPHPLVHDLAPELGEFVDLPRYAEACEEMRRDPSRANRLSYAALTTFALNGWLRSPARQGRFPQAQS